MENLRLIRCISTLYGGRPGTIGFWRLTRNVVAHLAATGAIAVGDGIVQQLVGHGLAARLSARLGEGVINGMLTARIGISAIDLCRPVPFINARRPGIAEFLGELARIDGLQKPAGSESFPAPGTGVATTRNMK
jgi:putative membrane protein